jgi:putative peptidoglycan lipid II flippase
MLNKILNYKKFTTTSVITGASIILTVFTLLSKGLGFIREMLFAGIFGLGADYDLYLVSSVVPVTISTILLYLGQNYFIPIFSKYEKTDKNLGILFFNFNLILFFIIGSLIALTLYLFAPAIINIYLAKSDIETKKQAIFIFSIFLISIPLYSVYSICAAYLQQKMLFFLPAVSQLALNLCIIILVPLFHIKYGIKIIPFSFIIGAFIQLSILLQKIKFQKLHYKDLLYFKDSIVSLSNSLIIIILIETISQLYVIADRYFFFAVDTGGIAAINYAMNIFILPISIIGMSVYTVIFPHITKLFNNKSYELMEIFIQKWIKIFLLIFIPLTIIFVFDNNTIINIIYRRGKFGYHESIMTGQILSYLSLSLFLFAIYGIINKIFYSFGMVKVLLIITVVSFIIKISSNYLLVPFMKQNGLALSWTITYLFLFVSSSTIIKKKYHLIKLSKFVYLTSFLILNGLISYFIIIKIVLPNISQDGLFTGLMGIFSFLILFYSNLVILKIAPIPLSKNIMNRA